MRNSMSGSRSAAAGQTKSSGTNAIRRAITNSRSVVKKQSLPTTPPKGGPKPS